MPDEVTAIHTALAAGAIPHAFGGAIALAFYGIPRYTDDIDVNIALPVGERSRVLDSLSALFPLSDRAKAEQAILDTAQTRVWWGEVAIDLFFADVPFHDSLAARTRPVDYGGTFIPIISAEDLIICKAAYNRPRDWLDIEDIFTIQQRKLDAGYLRRWLSGFFEPEDERVRKIEGYLRALG